MSQAVKKSSYPFVPSPKPSLRDLHCAVQPPNSLRLSAPYAPANPHPDHLPVTPSAKECKNCDCKGYSPSPIIQSSRLPTPVGSVVSSRLSKPAAVCTILLAIRVGVVTLLVTAGASLIYSANQNRAYRGLHYAIEMDVDICCFHITNLAQLSNAGVGGASYFLLVSQLITKTTQIWASAKLT